MAPRLTSSSPPTTSRARPSVSSEKQRPPTAYSTSARRSKTSCPPPTHACPPPDARKSTSDPVAVPLPRHSTSAAAASASTSSPASMPLFGRSAVKGSKRRPTIPTPPSHDPKAISPAVAALLAVTAIPPRKSTRRKPSELRQVSIDELVTEWKNDGSLKSSYGTSPVLGMLLEDLDDPADDSSVSGKSSFVDDDQSHMRSISSDSVPSLDADAMSVLSLNSPSTPSSLRSRRSYSYLRKDKPRSTPESEACLADHPLAPSAIDHDSDDASCDSLLSTPKARKSPAKPRSSFKSNLTTSLQALKNAALNSISSLSLANQNPNPDPSRRVAPFSDEMLWSHPFLFPRLSSEIRPTISGTPTEAERHYHNPTPLSFEEQEAPFQQALHAPFLAEKIDDHAPTIPMQTYHRTRRRNSSGAGNKRRGVGISSAGPDPQSEAGRALVGASGVRQREVRENSDFLRVVVLEMNMRRQGKIENGRAKIWLPPRKSSSPLALSEDGEGSKTPKRWVGVNAY